jgi:hypothetical protein
MRGYKALLIMMSDSSAVGCDRIIPIHQGALSQIISVQADAETAPENFCHAPDLRSHLELDRR